MKAVDCGYKYDCNSPCSPCDTKEGEKKEAPTFYPSVRLQGKAADKLIGSLRAGETVSANVKFKVIEVAKRTESDQPYSDNAGARVELELHAIALADEDQDMDEAGADASDGLGKI